MTTHTSDPTFAVLHAVRLRGVARDEWLESVLDGTSGGSVQDQLASLRDHVAGGLLDVGEERAGCPSTRPYGGFRPGVAVGMAGPPTRSGVS